MTSEGLQILTYAQHLWSLSSEGSLACHTYCDTRNPFLMVIFTCTSTRDTQTYCRAFVSGVITTCFYD